MNAILYPAGDTMCLTSNFEGLPMSLMEGQQYGVIPVSFDSMPELGKSPATERAESWFPPTACANTPRC